MTKDVGKCPLIAKITILLEEIGVAVYSPNQKEVFASQLPSFLVRFFFGMLLQAHIDVSSMQITVSIYICYFITTESNLCTLPRRATRSTMCKSDGLYRGRNKHISQSSIQGVLILKRNYISGN